MNARHYIEEAMRCLDEACKQMGTDWTSRCRHAELITQAKMWLIRADAALPERKAA